MDANWPSKNVPKGSVFDNARKMTYSADTQNFIKTLMEESKMATFQRNKINYSLRNGAPLPTIPKTEGRSRPKNPFEVKIRPGSSKRRSLDTIRQSGAYERERFRSIAPIVDREKAKEDLINRMVHGGALPPKPKPSKKKQQQQQQKKAAPKMNRFEELKQEIKEREDWLAEMEELGEARHYRGIIRLQIIERLKEIEDLKVQE